MRWFCVALVVLAGCAALQSAPQVDKLELRHVLRMPAVTTKFGFDYDPATGLFVPPGCLADIKGQLAKIRQELTGNASDAELYQQMSYLCEEDHNHAEAKKAIDTAVALFRQRVKNDPGNARLLAQLGLALSDADQEKDAETTLRKAIQLAPSDWKCWETLGVFQRDWCGLSARAAKSVGTQATDDAECWLKELDVKIDRRSAVKAAPRIKEARTCFDKAVELAPQESEAFLQRGMFRWFVHVCGPELKTALGENSLSTASRPSFAPDAAADLERAAQLKPDDPLLVGSVLWTQFVFSVHSTGRSFSPGDGNCWRNAPEQERQAWLAHLQQLETLATDPRTHVASQAAEILGLIHFVAIGNKDQAVKYYRKAVQLDPGRDFAWEMLDAMLYFEGKLDEALEANRQQVQLKPTPRNLFFLGKLLDKKGQQDEAEAALRAGLKLDENDFYCNLALAVVLLRQECQPSTGRVIFELLDRSFKTLGSRPDKERQWNWCLVAAAFDGIYSDGRKAPQLAGQAEQLFPTDRYGQQMLKAIGN